MTNKIIRTICIFSDSPSKKDVEQLDVLQNKFRNAGFEVQTKRICTNVKDFKKVQSEIGDLEVLISIGSLSLNEAQNILSDFSSSQNINFNLDLTQTEITLEHANLLFDILKGNPSNTFNFTYLFNAVPTPYFPSAIFKENGFAVGLQSTNLSEGCTTLEAWLESTKNTWQEIIQLMQNENQFLGIDSSVAPCFEGNSSLINFIKRLRLNFANSTTTDFYTKITKFIKSENPKPYGLNGLMFPCLEDFELADEYSKGEFSLERNIYLSLHSGLGIDTYPMGIDESPTRVLEILNLIKALCNKYGKSLAVRFVSDGKAKVGEISDFKNQYLKDVKILSL